MSWADHYLYNVLGLLDRLAVFFNFYFILVKRDQLSFYRLHDLRFLIVRVLFGARRQISISLFQRWVQLSSVLRLLERHRLLFHKLSVPVSFRAIFFFSWLVKDALKFKTIHLLFDYKFIAESKVCFLKVVTT